MAPKTIWNLPKIQYQALFDVHEERPVALITDQASWERLGSVLNLPVVVQAEPERTDDEFLDFLSENVPSVVEVVYVVGSGEQLAIGKVVAHRNNIPLVVVPTELDTDQLLEAHVELMNNGVIINLITGPAEQVVIDWDVITASDPHRRAGVVADMLAIVTGLLDWRFAAKLKRHAPDQPFVPWAAGVAAGIASHTIKIAESVGNGEVEALRTLVDLVSVSVQLANQLGHARQQEGTEHYFAAVLEKHNVKATHAECLAPGILLTSSLHKQDPSALRDAMQKAGIRLDQVRAADIQLAINDMPNFVLANDLPYAIAHEIDPFSDELQAALKMAGLSSDTGGWAVSGDTGAVAAVTSEPAPTQVSLPMSGSQQQPTRQQQVVQDMDLSSQQEGDTGAAPPVQGDTDTMPPTQQSDSVPPQGDTGSMPPVQPPSSQG